MNKISVAAARAADTIGQHVRLQGWVRTRRDSKAGFSFIELNDGSCLGNLQIIADQALPNYEHEIKSLSAGCSVTIEGEVKESGGKQATELHAASVTVHGWADPQEYPLQKKRHSLEKLREWAHLRPRTNTFGAVARVRNQVAQSIHQFFQDEGFLYIHTPIITASDCEGAGELFRVTTLNLEDPPRLNGRVDYSQDFFDRPTFLTVSGQLDAEIFAMALGKVYTFGPTFRAENSNTSRHLAEFWMVEPEAAFYELAENMQLAEAFLKRIFRDVLERCGEDMQFFAERVDQDAMARLEGMLAQEFAHIPYTEAIDILQNCGQKFEFPIQWGSDLQSEHERYLTEVHCRRPAIVTDYPRQIKPFYMRVNDDEKTVRAMDVLAPQIGEIIGGSQREERLDVLEARMREQDLPLEEYWWYRELRKFGATPHSGFGLGLERVLQLITGLGNIRDVIPFPRTPGNADF